MKYLDDALVLAGCMLITIGTWVAWPAATWFVAGGMCIGWGLAIGKARSKG